MSASTPDAAGTSRPRVLSGIQPTAASFHLGNYLGAVRNWRTGAIFASDGAPGEIKPDWGEADFRRGEMEVPTVVI